MMRNTAGSPVSPVSRMCCYGLLALLAGAGPSWATAAANEKPDKARPHWPSFRGPQACGVAEGHPTPVTWSVPGSRNIKWKTAIPGLGHSSPVVWGNRIFITTAVNTRGKSALKVGLYGDVRPARDAVVHRWCIYCVDKTSGRILWQRTAHKGIPRVKRHPKSTHANSTAATDGRHVVALLGSEGLFCYDLEGKLIWKKDLGVLDSGFYRSRGMQWGFGSSPVIHENMVIVQCDVLRTGFLAAFDLRDGKEIWRTPRKDVPTWSTPTVWRGKTQTQVIVNGYRHIGGYDVRTGRELWRMRGGGDIPVPTPVIGHGLVYVTNAHGRSPVYAIRLTARGDVSLEAGKSSNAHVAWSVRTGGSYMQTPLVYGDYVYVCRDNGTLSCFEAGTGKQAYRKSLTETRTGFSASAVAANGHLYYTSERGDVHVVRAGPAFKIAAVNPLGEVCLATPAVSEGVLLFRTRSHLVAIGRTGQ